MGNKLNFNKLGFKAAGKKSHTVGFALVGYG